MTLIQNLWMRLSTAIPKPSQAAVFASGKRNSQRIVSSPFQDRLVQSGNTSTFIALISWMNNECCCRDAFDIN